MTGKDVGKVDNYTPDDKPKARIYKLNADRLQKIKLGKKSGKIPLVKVK